MFVQQNFQLMTSVQQIRTYLSLKKLVNFKNEKLMAQLKKTTLSRVLSSSPMANIEDEDQFFS